MFVGRRARPFLLFDLGGVLVENIGFERLAALSPGGNDLPLLRERWLASPTVRAFELGRLEPDAFAAAFVDEWALAIAPAAFIDEFASWPRGFYEGVPTFLDDLRRTHRIGCLTNSNALHWRRFDGFAGLFDVALSSHLTGLIKPDRDCFEHAIAACGVPRERVVFLDDSPANVAGARAAGINARHVEGFEAARRAAASS